MILNVRNDTDKTIIVSISNLDFKIEPYSTKKIEAIENSDIIVNRKSNNKSFFTRMKEDLSVKEIDLLHLRFKICFYSYLKTVVNLKCSKKNAKIVITEQEFVRKKVLSLNCFSVDAVNCDNIDCSYRCVDKNQKRAMKISCHSALFINYGIIGLLFFPFFATVIDYLVNSINEDLDVFIFCLLFSIVSFVFLVLFIIKLININSIIKKI